MPEYRKIKLPRACLAWGEPDFEHVLKTELEGLQVDQLPLQAGIAASSYALSGPFQAMVIAASANDAVIHVKAGVFYQGIVAGCSCADDPTPTEPVQEYCEIALDLDRTSCEAAVHLLAGQPE